LTRTPESEEVTEEWANPKPDEPLYSSEIGEALGMVELMLENFSEHPAFLKTLSGQILKMIENEDWRVKFCGLMTLSQVYLALQT
jgi:hypothetical protein